MEGGEDKPQAAVCRDLIVKLPIDTARVILTRDGMAADVRARLGRRTNDVVLVAEDHSASRSGRSGATSISRPPAASRFPRSSGSTGELYGRRRASRQRPPAPAASS